MRCISFVMALVAGCSLQVDRDSDANQTSFTRVVNRTDATVVLVDPDLWDAPEPWFDDCDEKLLFDTDGDELLIESPEVLSPDDCRVEIRSDRVHVITLDGDGDLDQDGEIDLSSITVNGNGDVHVSRLDTDRLEVFARGNGAIEVVGLEADDMFLDVSGNSAVSLAGFADVGEFHLAGNGDLDAADLVVGDLFIELKGNGSAVVTVDGSIEGSVTGSGDLTVLGNPQGEVEDNGSGTVTYGS